MLQVTTRTLRNWENGSSRIPYAAFRLMRLFGGHCLMGKAWEGWSMWNGALWTPEGRRFEQHELRYLTHYLWMARHWLAERQARASASPSPQTQSPGRDSPAVWESPSQSARDIAACQLLPRRHGLRPSPAWSEFGTIDGLGKIAANDDSELGVN